MNKQTMVEVTFASGRRALWTVRDFCRLSAAALAKTQARLVMAAPPVRPTGWVRAKRRAHRGLENP